MVKLDVEAFRHITSDEFRVLVAIEMGMKNHELVPTPLIERIAGLRHGGVKKLLGNLLRLKLIHHDSKKYDGFHLIYPGYDFLAIKTFMKRNTLFAVGRQIGVGKESDIHIVINDKEEENVIKFHRLGRVSFRAVKAKRDYLKGRKTSNWLYLSRLSALKEYAFMKALYEEGFPVPTPIDCNRHCVLMSLVNGFPLYQVRELGNPAKVYKSCMDLIVRFAQYGLIHSDFNEFNLLLKEEDESIIVIDFPQMVSTSHKNADMYFSRDVDCIIAFFAKRFNYFSKYKPVLTDIIKEHSLDVKVEASGFSADLAKEFDEMQTDEKEESDEEEGEEGEEAQENEENEKQPAEPRAPKEVQEPTQETTSTPQSEPAVPEAVTETTAPGTEPATTETTEEVEDETDEVATTASAVDSNVAGSSIDYEYIKRRVKQTFAKKKGQKDYRTAQRNTQKGKDKRNARNTIKNGGEF